MTFAEIWTPAGPGGGFTAEQLALQPVVGTVAEAQQKRRTAILLVALPLAGLALYFAFRR